MNTNDDKNHLYDVVNDFDVAMLVTQAANAIHARPMSTVSLMKYAKWPWGNHSCKAQGKRYC